MEQNCTIAPLSLYVVSVSKVWSGLTLLNVLLEQNISVQFRFSSQQLIFSVLILLQFLKLLLLFTFNYRTRRFTVNCLKF